MSTQYLKIFHFGFSLFLNCLQKAPKTAFGVSVLLVNMYSVIKIRALAKAQLPTLEINLLNREVLNSNQKQGCGLED